jgi:hypothetical protein
MPSDERESLSVRKIDNGWLIERSGSRKGKWFNSTEFSADKPSLVASPVKGRR